MTHFKFIPFLVLLVFSLINYQLSHSQTTISIQDFDMLNNTSWEGTLTYLDYQNNKLVPVSTTMQIKLHDNIIEQNIQYTWEPTKNVLSRTKIKKKGRYLGKQKILSKTIQDDGSVILITTSQGFDDLKKATLFYTYEFNNDHYKVKKEVQFEGSEERFMRNQYIYQRL